MAPAPDSSSEELEATVEKADENLQPVSHLDSDIFAPWGPDIDTVGVPAFLTDPDLRPDELFGFLGMESDRPAAIHVANGILLTVRHLPELALITAPLYYENNDSAFIGRKALESVSGEIYARVIPSVERTEVLDYVGPIGNDWALLEEPARVGDQHARGWRRADSLSPGERLWFIGSRDEEDRRLIATGLLGGFNGVTGVLCESDAAPGHSGAPMVDREGYVVGIAKARDLSQGHTYFVTIESIVEHLTHFRDQGHDVPTFPELEHREGPIERIPDCKNPR